MTPTPAPEPNALARLSQAGFQKALHEHLRVAIRLTLTLIVETKKLRLLSAPHAMDERPRAGTSPMATTPAT